jgi:alpha-amylase/alpha-mannosidase (GH57 family)
MHALKDYYGMVRILEEFPQVHQTFNLVPSMMAQLTEYAEGKAADPYLQMVLRPAESLSGQDREFLLRHSFYSDPQHMIRRYPRYAELYDAWQAQRNSGSRSLFGVQEFRDLQMWSQLAWFDEEFQEHDPEVSDWIRRGRNFNIADQQRMGAKQRDIIGHVLPEYRKLASAGRIEISTTPYYHPILPLLCDSNIAGVSHPGVPLPPRFHYPQDARLQLAMARDSIVEYFGAPPAGLWPSEGSVSDEALSIAAELGFEWTATDSGVLNRTLGRGVSVDGLYRPYQWCQGNRRLGVLFRDHFLSDLIGFVYSKMDAHAAAADFLRRIRENCGGILSSGRNALVPIILDGENAWEYYDRNGREFLRELYRSIEADPSMSAVTVSEGMRLMAPEPLDHIFPGSWINANFDVWIGAEEDNEAWTQLLRARQTYDATQGVPEERRRLAMEELLIAEGSDWCWWYGPEHDSANRVEFDELFRSHLANVYRFLNLAPPDTLSRPILHAVVPELVTPASGAITPVIDGEISSYFEWIGAGSYRVDARSGSMHGKKFLVDEVLYGSEGQNLFLRLDFRPGSEADLAGAEARLVVETLDRKKETRMGIGLRPGGATAPEGVECSFGRVLEVRIPLASVGIPPGAGLRFQFSLWQGGLPLDAIPQQGWIEMATTDPVELVS